MKFFYYLLLNILIIVPAFSQPISQFEQLEGLNQYIDSYHIADTYTGSDTAWENSNRRIQKFNTMSKPIEFTQSKWENGILVNDSKNFYTYQNDSLLVETSSQEWRESQWNDASKTSYNYDDNLRISSIITQQKRQGEWVISRMVVTEYDENGRQSKVTTYQNNALSVDTTLVTFTYDIDGNLIEQLNQKFRNDKWNNLDATYLEYNNDKLIKRTEVFWYADELYNDKYDTLMYDENGLLIETLRMKWYDDTFEKDHRYLNYYNTNSSLDSVIYETWVGIKWVSFTRTNYTRDEQDRIINKAGQKYRSEAWVDELNTDYAYNDNNKLDSVEVYFKMGETWSRNSKVLYDYVTVGVVESNLPSVKGMNFPNPFVENTTIRFDLKNPSNLNMTILSLDGYTVEDINLGYYSEGNHELKLNLSSLSAGNYIYIINGTNEQITNIFTIVK